MIKNLLKYNVDLNCQNEKGQTALHLAIINGSIECLEDLLGKEGDHLIEKINWNLYEERGYNCLHLCVVEG